MNKCQMNECIDIVKWMSNWIRPNEYQQWYRCVVNNRNYVISLFWLLLDYCRCHWRWYFSGFTLLDCFWGSSSECFISQYYWLINDSRLKSILTMMSQCSGTGLAYRADAALMGSPEEARYRSIAAEDGRLLRLVSRSRRYRSILWCSE